MGKKQSDINNRESKKERKKNSNDKSIYTSKHIRAKETLLMKRTETILPVKINEKK